eukprot:1153357-Pelagomonas_calceolata.AAC.1
MVAMVPGIVCVSNERSWEHICCKQPAASSNQSTLFSLRPLSRAFRMLCFTVLTEPFDWPDSLLIACSIPLFSMSFNSLFSLRPVIGTIFFQLQALSHCSH